MTRRLILAWLVCAGFALALPAAAQESAHELRQRAEEIVALLRGEGDPEQIFSPGFLAQVPATQVRAIGERFANQYGDVRGLGRIELSTPHVGTFQVDYERATAQFSITVEPQPPYRVSGLLFTGAEMRGDSFAAILAEIAQLPGRSGVAVARLGDSGPQLIARHEPERSLAIGSAFKLWLLAELSSQVQAGQRRWSDVVRLDRRSTPSGTLQAWPQGSPVTLHTLAALMISVSDNTATDMLLHTLGREPVERVMSRIGVDAAARNRPLLSTLEFGTIKTGSEADSAAWLGADEAGRRRLLATRYAALDPARIDVGRFAGNPLHIDSIEWFASPADLVRTMDWLRRNGDETAQAILAINPGLPPQTRSGFSYVGFKGGSEPGVINLTYLIRNRAGRWHVVTGSWNNPAAPIDEARFAGLMARLVALLR